jgi:osmotically inducible protein OsmC
LEKSNFGNKSIKKGGIMPVRKANAVWNGDLMKGNGIMEFGSGAFKGNYSFGSRFEEAKGTNPEELIGAAHAGCFSMAFSGALGANGFKPEKVQTEAKVAVEKVGNGFTITTVELSTEARVPDIDNDRFQALAEDAKKNCPVSRALAGVRIRLNAKLV